MLRKFSCQNLKQKYRSVELEDNTVKTAVNRTWIEGKPVFNRKLNGIPIIYAVF